MPYDRSEDDHRCLTFDTEPLAEDLEIVGSPEVVVSPLGRRTRFPAPRRPLRGRAERPVDAHLPGLGAGRTPRRWSSAAGRGVRASGPALCDLIADRAGSASAAGDRGRRFPAPLAGTAQPHPRRALWPRAWDTAATADRALSTGGVSAATLPAPESLPDHPKQNEGTTGFCGISREKRQRSTRCPASGTPLPMAACCGSSSTTCRPLIDPDPRIRCSRHGSKRTSTAPPTRSASASSRSRPGTRFISRQALQLAGNPFYKRSWDLDLDAGLPPNEPRHPS